MSKQLVYIFLLLMFSILAESVIKEVINSTPNVTPEIGNSI